MLGAGRVRFGEIPGRGAARDSRKPRLQVYIKAPERRVDNSFEPWQPRWTPLFGLQATRSKPGTHTSHASRHPIFEYRLKNKLTITHTPGNFFVVGRQAASPSLYLMQQLAHPITQALKLLVRHQHIVSQTQCDKGQQFLLAERFPARLKQVISLLHQFLGGTYALRSGICLK